MVTISPTRPMIGLDRTQSVPMQLKMVKATTVTGVIWVLNEVYEVLMYTRTRTLH